MERLCGARNTIGFTSKLQESELPPQTHLTYEGIFNQIKFNVGPKTNKILDLSMGYSRFMFQDSLFDNKMNEYLAIFLKSKFDGEDRSQKVKMNISICLDVSGSMSCGLGNAKSEHNRLSLLIQAIRMLISKLKPQDSFSLVIFDHQAQVIIDQMLKKEVTSDTYQRLSFIRAKGGTTIINGFKQSKQLLKKWNQKLKNEVVQNRIVLLTDVCDDSLKYQKKAINDSAQLDRINTTIIGISTQFRSQICQHLKDIKGFSYFCAVEEEDLKKYVFQTFDFGFFPSAHNISLQLCSQGITDIEVYGTPDSDKVKNYQSAQARENNIWPITKLKSTFPSQIQIHGHQIFTYGGSILVKLHRQSEKSVFKGYINMEYQSIQGERFKEKYQLNFEFHPHEQFFSGEEQRCAIQGYVFTSQLKNILKDCKEKKEKHQILQRYWPLITKLETLCPQSKKKEYENIKKIIQKYIPNNEKLYE